MSYAINSRNRRLKQTLTTTLHRLSFHFFHLSAAKKVIFIGLAFAEAGLFFEWFATPETEASYNAFQLATGYIGYTITIIVSILLFLLLSNKNKEALKSRMRLGFSDTVAFMGGGIVILLLAFSVYQSTRGYGIYLTTGVRMGDAVTVELIGAIFMIAGAWLKYAQEKKEIVKQSYVEHSQSKDALLEEYRQILDRTAPSKEKDANMSLPV